MNKTYQEFTEYILYSIKRLYETDGHIDFIINFTCVEPTADFRKAVLSPFKRSEYIEVVSLNDNDNGLIWFNDWYEGIQSSFSIKSIIPIDKCCSIMEENELLHTQNNNLYDALRDCYEYVGSRLGEFS